MATAVPKDPRRSVTPDAFHVAPELLGLPLAGPWRRLGAMLVDLFVLGLLVNAGGVFLAIAAAVTVFRATAGGKASLLRTSGRFMLRSGAALVLFIAVLVLWSEGEDLIEDWGQDDEPAEVDVPEITEEARGVQLGGMGALRVLGDWRALSGSTSQEDAAPAARDLVARLRDSGMSEEDLRELRGSVEEFSEIDLPPHAIAALRDAVDAALPADAAPTAADSLVEPAEDASTADLLDDYASALAEDDSAATARIAALLGPRVAADTIRALGRRVERLRDEVEDANEDLERVRAEVERRSGARWVLSFILDDLGLGFGWSGLYFTAFLVLMKGQTPGKRLLRARVIRLDGRPVGWWVAFERFGGYGASIVTGLLGFAEILWDRNRQGMHDKIARTVVVRV